MADRRTWCSKCQEWTSPGHASEHSDPILTFDQRSMAFSLAVRTLIREGNIDVDPEELTEVLENEGALDSDLMKTAYNYIENNKTNIEKTAIMVNQAAEQVVIESIEKSERKTNGHHPSYSEMKSLENFGYDSSEDLEIF
jgi:hypothetical protein